MQARRRVLTIARPRAAAQCVEELWEPSPVTACEHAVHQKCDEQGGEKDRDRDVQKVRLMTMLCGPKCALMSHWSLTNSAAGVPCARRPDQRMEVSSSVHLIYVGALHRHRATINSELPTVGARGSHPAAARNREKPCAMHRGEMHGEDSGERYAPMRQCLPLRLRS